MGLSLDDPDLGAGLRGFRVLCTAISPRARRGYVDRGLYDHTSVLKMFEWQFGLAPLTVCEAGANNLASIPDFSVPSVLATPRYNVPMPLTLGCLLADHTHCGEDWPDLLKLAGERGLAVKFS